MATKKKGGLGKGLDALFMDNTTESGPVTLRIAEIEPNREQPRKEFDESALADLADSIREHGVIQPLLVRPMPTGGYQLVAGERRWRASRMAGLTEVPVVIRELSDHETMELALIENLQRQDLNPMEEALGYQSLMNEYAMTQEQVSKVIGKSRPAIANSLRLLSLPTPVVELVREGKLSAGHGRALLALDSEEAILEAAELAVKKGMSVRETEKLAQQAKKEPKKPVLKPEDTYYKELELALTQVLGRQVSVTAKGKTRRLSVEFFDKDDLAALAEKLCVGHEEA
ncbi:MAG: ParB/RepB/Spo0J family partition protein [Oscillospiraceae bacterium]|nr:ParB/RepB/Spo0J family partition protein [Oscillospiraceae bacterium]MBQ3242193.1 ParB/RepB/Spo0J family partition protein [Oscillospiraceae bacterium]MBQ7082061.1 ParB/RepB/Spo0J family partition protein [Oscillospiraceae bacterium]